MLNNNIIALVITLVVALTWLRINNFFAQRGLISSQLSRKIIHTGTGPLFVICWLLFTDAPSSRWLAALVPLGITIQFLLVGLGVVKDQASVDGMSRSGDRKEILKGPLYYGIVFVVMTVVYWFESPIGIIALMLLCGGDGMADIIGKRIRSKSLTWSKEKTWAGTAAMFTGGWLFSLLVLGVFSVAGKFSNDFSGLILPVTIIALCGALIESLPLKDADNITVPVVAVVLGHWLI